MTRAVYTVTTRPRQRRRHMDARAVCRGVAAVAVLLLTAADALLTAAIGIRPLACTMRRLAGAYRQARGGIPCEPPAVITVVPEPCDPDGGP